MCVLLLNFYKDTALPTMAQVEEALGVPVRMWLKMTPTQSPCGMCPAFRTPTGAQLRNRFHELKRVLKPLFQMTASQDDDLGAFSLYVVGEAPPECFLWLGCALSEMWIEDRVYYLRIIPERVVTPAMLAVPQSFTMSSAAATRSETPRAQAPPQESDAEGEEDADEAEYAELDCQ